MHVIRESVGNDRTNYVTVCTHILVTRHLSGIQTGAVVNWRQQTLWLGLDHLLLLALIGLGNVSGDEAYQIWAVVKSYWSSINAEMPENPRRLHLEQHEETC